MNKNTIAVLIAIIVSAVINYGLFISPDIINSIIYSTVNVGSAGYLMADLFVGNLVFLGVYKLSAYLLVVLDEPEKIIEK